MVDSGLYRWAKCAASCIPIKNESGDGLRLNYLSSLLDAHDGDDNTDTDMSFPSLL